MATWDYASGLFFISYLEENEWDVSNVWFQQDGATARVSMNVVRETFAERLISKNGDNPRSPRAPATLSYTDKHHITRFSQRDNRITRS